MQTLQAMHMAELSNTQSRTLYPHLSPAHAHGSPNHKPLEKMSAGKMYDQKKDVLYGTKCISIISRLPLVSTFELFLQSLYDVVLEQEPPALSLISYVYNIIHEVPLLPPGRSMRLTIPKQSIVCQRPGTVMYFINWLWVVMYWLHLVMHRWHRWLLFGCNFLFAFLLCYAQHL